MKVLYLVKAALYEYLVIRPCIPTKDNSQYLSAVLLSSLTDMPNDDPKLSRHYGWQNMGIVQQTLSWLSKEIITSTHHPIDPLLPLIRISHGCAYPQGGSRVCCSEISVSSPESPWNEAVSPTKRRTAKPMVSRRAVVFYFVCLLPSLAPVLRLVSDGLSRRWWC